jgi:hypothetical protein
VASRSGGKSSEIMNGEGKLSSFKSGVDYQTGLAHFMGEYFPSNKILRIFTIEP